MSDANCVTVPIPLHAANAKSHRMSGLSSPEEGGGWQRRECDCTSCSGCRAGHQTACLSARLKERLRERERIARELHDTLLQGTQALILMVNSVATRMQPSDPVREILTNTLLRAEALMAQGRDRIQNLRVNSGTAIDVAQSLANAWRDLGAEREFRILVEGRSRELRPDVGDEIALIGREALTNALRHSGARAIEAQIIFDDEQVRMAVRDDGLGLGKDVLVAGCLAGHWGLSGMRERAQSIFGTLSIRSAPGAGTEVELTVPSSSAYR